MPAVVAKCADECPDYPPPDPPPDPLVEPEVSWLFDLGEDGYQAISALALDSSSNLALVGRFEQIITIGGSEIVSAGGLDVLGSSSRPRASGARAMR